MLRRTALKRGKPLSRKTALKSTGTLKRGGALPRKRAKPRRSSRKLDPKYLAFVRTLPCCICCARPPVDPHHDTYGRGLSQKSDDDRAIPACRLCHGEAQDRKGRFKGWSKEDMREWHERKVQDTRALYRALKVAGERPGEGDIA